MHCIKIYPQVTFMILRQQTNQSSFVPKFRTCSYQFSLQHIIILEQFFLARPLTLSHSSVRVCTTSLIVLSISFVLLFFFWVNIELALSYLCIICFIINCYKDVIPTCEFAFPLGKFSFPNTTRYNEISYRKIDIQK